MAEPTELEHLRAAERRLALLALTGQQPETDGPCLSAGQLAALVEGNLPPAEVDACLVHVAACEHCFFQWRQLDREWQEQGAKRPRTALSRFIRQPRFLTTAGSLLAAAASIAVFFTLTTRIDRTTLTRLPEKSAQEQMVPAPESIQPASPAPAEKSVPAPAPPPESRLQAPRADVLANRHQAERKKEAGSDQSDRHGARQAAAVQSVEKKAKIAKQDQQTQPAPTVTAAPVPLSGGTVPPVAEPGEAENFREAAGPAGKPASVMPRAAAPQVPTVTADAAVPLALDDWRRRIRQGCQTRPGSEFFAAIARQGQQLLRDSEALATQDRLQIERILTALGREQPAEQKCRVLQGLVDPAGQRQGR